MGEINTVDDIIVLYKSNDKSTLLRSTKSLNVIFNALSTWNCNLENNNTPIILANIASEVIKENVSLLLPILKEFYQAITYLITQNLNQNSSNDQQQQQQPLSPTSSPKDIINTSIFTLFGNVCFLFAKNESLLSQSVPYVLEIGKLSTPIQTIVYSTIATEAVNQAQVLAPFVKDLINYSSIYPNYYTILCGLYQHNQKDFESSVPALVDSFEKYPECRASILAVMESMSKQTSSSLLIIPYLAKLKLALKQESLSNMFSIILKNVLMRHPYVMGCLFQDVLEAITNENVARYTLIEDVGLSYASHTRSALEFLIGLLRKEESKSKPDSNTLVAILKGMKAIQKTSPNLLTSATPFNRYAESGKQESEFIATLAQELIENTKVYRDRKDLINPLPALIDTEIESLDQKTKQCVESELVGYKVDTLDQIDQYLLINKPILILEWLRLIPIPYQFISTLDKDEEIVVVNEKKLPENNNINDNNNNNDNNNVNNQPKDQQQEQQEKENKDDNNSKENNNNEEKPQDNQNNVIPILKISKVQQQILQFSFGGETVELNIDGGQDLMIWKRVNYLQSVVNLQTFIPSDKVTESELNEIRKQPFITIDQIKEIHKKLVDLLEKTSLSPRNNVVSSPVSASVSLGESHSTTNLPSLTIEEFNNPNGGGFDNTLSSVNSDHGGNSSSGNGGGAGQGGILIYQGYLKKKSKYLRRYEELWVELYRDTIIGIKKHDHKQQQQQQQQQQNEGNLTSSKSSNSIANSPPNVHEELNIKISDIKEIRVVESHINQNNSNNNNRHHRKTVHISNPFSNIKTVVLRRTKSSAGDLKSSQDNNNKITQKSRDKSLDELQLNNSASLGGQSSSSSTSNGSYNNNNHGNQENGGKYFYLITAKRKYLFKSSDNHGQEWINKIRSVNGSAGNQLIPTTAISPSITSPEMESTPVTSPPLLQSTLSEPTSPQLNSQQQQQGDGNNQQPNNRKLFRRFTKMLPKIGKEKSK